MVEETLVCGLGVKSVDSRGRKRPEEECSVRTAFQRDIDRIIHSKSFRRLKHKTQVFLRPEGDHYRTRLTHTLEVTRIARTIARALELNEDLTEAIALGHDLGHTPFGHAGERALSRCSGRSFQHNEQSVRVVEKLEKKGAGLNLTWEVRNGMLNHKTSCTPATLEGKIVRLADKIAYVNHDMDDAIRGGIMKESDLPISIVKALGSNTRDRLDCLIHDVIDTSYGTDTVEMSEEIGDALSALRRYMFEYLYTNPVAKSEEVKAEKLLEILYDYYMEDQSRLNNESIEMLYMGEDLTTVICDYIAGMTDNYAIETFKEIYVPGAWKGV